MQTTSVSVGIWKKQKILQLKQRTGEGITMRETIMAFLNNKYRQQSLV